MYAVVVVGSLIRLCISPIIGRNVEDLYVTKMKFLEVVVIGMGCLGGLHLQINSIVETSDNNLVAADAKLNFEDDVAYRQKDEFALRDPIQEDPREVHNLTEPYFLIDSAIKEHRLHPQPNDSDTDSVEIIEFSEAFSPYKSQLEREFEEEICRLEKERKRSFALANWKWEEVIDNQSSGDNDPEVDLVMSCMVFNQSSR